MIKLPLIHSGIFLTTVTMSEYSRELESEFTAFTNPEGPA